MKSAILIPIVKDVFDLVAYNKSVIAIDCRVSCIKNTVDVLAKQDAIGFGVCPAFRIRTNVCCI